MASRVTQTSAILDDRFVAEKKYVTMRGIAQRARHQLSDSAWDYLWCGTGDETLTERNVEKFNELLWEKRLFTGVSNPTTHTSVLGIDLSFPVFTAPFGQEATFYPDGHLAVGRAAAQVGISQMVPVAASYTLEEIAEASPVASMYQMSLVGDEQDNIDMAQRAMEAGYRYIVLTFSPIRQWRERLMENRFYSRTTRQNVNYGPGVSNPAHLKELTDFTKPRATWAEVRSFVKRSPLPVVVKGIESAADAVAAMDAGVAGLYVSNFGARGIDRTLAAIEVLPEVRAAVGGDVPIIFDSGIRRGSDIAAAIALGADAVAVGRVVALGLAADGEFGVASALEILREEFWMTLGHLGCSSVSELGPHVFRNTFSS